MVKNKGFTLIELLVVMSILSVLVSIIAGGFRSSQARGRDAQRKADLKQIANSLELFYADYGKYPDDSTGDIVGCPYAISGSTTCSWGQDEFNDVKTTYFKTLPKDPSNNSEYFYRIADSPINQKFQIFARLENSQDQDCLDEDCANSPVTYTCGVQVCNFAVTSPNTNATE